MKNYLFVSAVSMMMLAACSNEENIPIEGPSVPPTGSEILLSLSSGGDNTRSSRPVYSSEAANNVSKVQIYIYDASGAPVTATALYSGTQNPLVWNAGPNDAASPGTDPTHKASQTIKLNKLASDGIYTITAYAFNDAADYTVTAGNKNADSFSAALPNGKSESELFSGSATFEVVNGNIKAGTTCEVVMKRQVAGLLGYFKNIPVLFPNPLNLGIITPVQYLRVYASSHSTAFTFPSALAVNATGNNTKTKVLEYDFTTLVSNFLQQITNAGSNLAATFNINVPVGGATVVNNSVLAGKFLIPFSAVPNNTTFTIQLESSDGTVLKSWDVVNNSLTGDKKVYDVNRNYFYSIGQKYKASTTTGPTDGPDDDDQPIDLSKETVITLTVNDAWDMIYNLGIE